ncbi:ADP-ribosylglycohydrolase family protein [Metabacillus iocasae]|uniref:ADP-ribosylglycohydrolase n=1 Tax=Priestia iocasae TaxID=2291674 RepID=A0ABS2QTM0_9BACI|nr:ADP-ribosylglycohydrolase family protein [Metabacillus iocasae]MBM7702106.1 ADP-ribosylglycohydrolase [Metabacillus iocasae]
MRRGSLQDKWDSDESIYIGVTIKERLYPTILGGIVGDALGVPVEFKDRDTINVTTMTGYGTYNQPEGTWSDDTSLTMCLIETIIEGKDERGLMEKFEKYWSEGYWTPYGEMFDIGIATSDAISRYKKGLPESEWGGKGEYDNGNGALMRIAPLAFTLWDELDFNKRREEVERVAHVTHCHPRSTLGCIIYMEYLLRLFSNNKPLDAYERAINICKRHLTGTIYEQEFAAYSRIMDLSLPTLERDNIQSTGYVVSSLEASIWCFLNTDNYKDAVLAAVNLGGDTDTIGFITGTIAGMYYKMDGIPKEWMDQLARKDDLLDACKRFFHYCHERADIQRKERGE